ncbi:MAG: SDR family NAD(P)-dependent oxidoreductase [Candidatus Eremiobacteraeota bacterium]|nr:SDR family NAD(P)-dependent oxidoreductase [Candidatus Eremiobacteraeota bacterium]
MKSMIVTGASSGIGRAVALAAAKAGFAIVAVGRRAPMLEELSSEIHAAGGLCTTLPIDLRLPNAAAAIVSTAIQRYERIDAIVHAAGTAAAGALLAQSDAQLAEQWEIHVLGPLRLTREALSALGATRGHIFLFGSGVAAVPTAGLGAYPAAKAAVRAMAIQLRRELHQSGIAVTYVDPGAVETPLMERASLKGPAKRLRTSPERVASRIIRSLRSRPARVSAVPWQSAAVSVGEMLPALTERVLRRMPNIVGAQPMQQSQPEVTEAIQSSARAQPATPPTTLDEALEPLKRRLERVRLSRDFVAGLLVPGTTLSLSEVAMRWAGMPNKNERAATHEMLDALTDAGLLEKSGEERWIVRKSADGQ